MPVVAAGLQPGRSCKIGRSGSSKLFGQEANHAPSIAAHRTPGMALGGL